jgi:hypothetical protein
MVMTPDDRGLPDMMDPYDGHIFGEVPMGYQGMMVESDADQISSFGELSLDDLGTPTHAAVTTVPGGARPRVSAPIQLPATPVAMFLHGDARPCTVRAVLDSGANTFITPNSGLIWDSLPSNQPIGTAGGSEVA